MKKIIFFIAAFIVAFIVYFYLGSLIGTTKLSFNFLTVEQRQTIKKIFFPFRLISQQESTLSTLRNDLSQQEINISKLPFFKVELDFKESLEDVEIKNLKDLKLSNNKIMNRYEFINGFFSGILGKIPGGYIDFHNNNLLILSSRGILAYNGNINSGLNFKQIKNNINEFIGLKQFEKIESLSIKDLLVHKDKIFFSYVEEIREDCFNTSVAYGDVDYKIINFKKLFSFKDCVDLPPSNYSYSFQSGGRIVNFDDNHILLSVGDYRENSRPQDQKTINGKIIKIDINSGQYEIISIGHRNPQGLYYDKENKLILETEHGPLGGDEINLIDVSKITKNTPLNFGWPIASAGEHYCKKSNAIDDECAKIYKNYPLYKSHVDNGFVEPLKSFVPSIAISEVTKIKDRKYVLASMGGERLGDKSLYFFELDSDNKIINLEQIKIFQRIRDIIFNNNKLYLFFERPASIGVITLN
jgi:hypothetical protein